MWMCVYNETTGVGAVCQAQAERAVHIATTAFGALDLRLEQQSAEYSCGSPATPQLQPRKVSEAIKWTLKGGGWRGAFFPGIVLAPYHFD